MFVVHKYKMFIHDYSDVLLDPKRSLVPDSGKTT